MSPSRSVVTVTDLAFSMDRRAPIAEDPDMKCTQYYPVIQTRDVSGTAGFYQRHFRFKAAFDSDWYVHLQSIEDPSVNLAVLQADHDTIPEQARGITQGLIINFEVDDVDGVYADVQSSKPPR